MVTMVFASRGMRMVYDKEGIDPCKCDAHSCQCVPVTLFRTGINDDESGLHHDYEPFGKLRTGCGSKRCAAGCTQRRAAVVAATRGRPDFDTWDGSKPCSSTVRTGYDLLLLSPAPAAPLPFCTGGP